jgi:hypothetical protein
VALECVSAAGAPTGPSPTPRFRPPVCEIRRSAWSPRDLSWQFFGLFPFVFLAWRPPGTGADHDRCQARERRRSRATARQGQGRAAIGAESAPTTRRLNPACKGSVARPASAARRGVPDPSAVCVAITNPRKPRSSSPACRRTVAVTGPAAKRQPKPMQLPKALQARTRRGSRGDQRVRGASGTPGSSQPAGQLR